MRMAKKLLSMVVCAALILLLPNAAYASVEPRAVNMAPGSVTMRIGDARSLRVSLTPSNATDTLTLSLGNPGIATAAFSVDAKGNITGVLVTAVGLGQTTVTVTSGNGRSASCLVSVREDDHRAFDTRQVELLFDTVTLRVGQERTLYVDVSPATANDRTVTWESSNDEIVMVDMHGVITGRRPGTAEITASSHNGRSAVCKVTVTGAALVAQSNTAEILGAATLRQDVQNRAGNTVFGQIELIYAGKTHVSTAALRSAAATAAEYSKEAVLRFRTLDDNGDIQGQFSISPHQASIIDMDIQLEVFTAAAQTAATRTRANSYFGSPAAVVRLAHEGAFNMDVRVAARAGLGGISREEIKIYRFWGGVYTLHSNQEYYIDPGGYIHFTVSEGGFYIFV